MSPQPSPVLTKTLTDGRTAIVIIEPAPGGGVLAAVARVDGVELGSHCGPHHLAPNMPDGYVAAIGRLLLTAEEAAQMEAAYRAAEAAQPADPLTGLLAERERLVAAVEGYTDQWTDDRSATFHAGDHPNPFAADARNEQLINDAEAALVAFDAAHPEVVAAVRAERDAAMRRHLGD
jgi:hypothetical protein